MARAVATEQDSHCAQKKETVGTNKDGENKLPIFSNTLDVDVINTDSSQLGQKLVMSKRDYAMGKERAIKYRQTS